MLALLDTEIILWQDFEYNHSNFNSSDLLRLVLGERIGVRLPGALNTGFNNTAPIFYSALQPITPPRWAEVYDKKVTAMNDRFLMRTWRVALPSARRVHDLPHCTRCFASFVLDNDAAWHAVFS